MQMYAAIDIGGTKTLIAIFDENGSIVRSIKFPTNHDYQQFISDLPGQIYELSQLSIVKSVCVAVPGHVEDDTDIVEGFGNLDWKNKDIAGDLQKSLSIPVIIDNDANLGGLGEAVMGAGQGKRKVLYITVSTGIGTGVVVDGQLDPATKESEGGQILLEHEDQMMPWEKFASGKAFYEKYGKQGKDVDDLEIWKDFANNLAQGVWNLIAVIQPDIVVIGGSMGEHFHKYGDFLNQAIANFSSSVIDHPPIVQAKFPDEAVINGCYQAAKQHASTV
jgi:predicted NBD/HSP70 family sugar kinase